MAKWMNDKEVAEQTGLSVHTLRRDRFRGQGIPYSKVGRSCRYSQADVTAFMEAHRIEPQAGARV